METKDAAVRDELYEEAQLLRRRQQDYKSELAGLPSEGSSLPVVRSCDIEAVVAAWSGIPVERLTEDEISKLVRLVSIKGRLLDCMSLQLHGSCGLQAAHLTLCVTCMPSHMSGFTPIICLATDACACFRQVSEICSRYDRTPHPFNACVSACNSCFTVHSWVCCASSRHAGSSDEAASHWPR